MSRTRVLFLIDSVSDAGGAERFTLGLATHLPSDRFEVWLCSTRSTDPVAAATLAAAGVRHVSLGRESKLDSWRFAALARLLRRRRFDVLHSHMFGSNLWGATLGAACRVPVRIAHEHTWSYEGQPLRRWIDGHVIGRLATRFVAVSKRDAERMVSIEHVPADKVLMIPSAYVSRPSANADLRSELGLPRSAKLVAAVAVLRRQKALDVLLSALPAVLARVPDAHLVIAGDGPCRADLIAHAQEAGVAEHVSFLGLRHDAEAILRDADVAVISSDYEGTPLVAFECFANRTPLVATAVGGLPEMIDDGVTGRLVAPRSPDALAAAIVDLLENPELRDQIAARAAASPVNVTIEDIAARFATLYEQLLAERRPR